jgi:diadenosine tetraphosphatase ApaH/serine/threonine PP2A family protein phosphatase
MCQRVEALKWLHTTPHAGAQAVFSTAPATRTARDRRHLARYRGRHPRYLVIRPLTWRFASVIPQLLGSIMCRQMPSDAAWRRGSRNMPGTRSQANGQVSRA